MLAADEDAGATLRTDDDCTRRTGEGDGLGETVTTPVIPIRSSTSAAFCLAAAFVSCLAPSITASFCAITRRMMVGLSATNDGSVNAARQKNALPLTIAFSSTHLSAKQAVTNVKSDRFAVSIKWFITCFGGAEPTPAATHASSTSFTSMSPVVDRTSGRGPEPAANEEAVDEVGTYVDVAGPEE